MLEHVQSLILIAAFFLMGGYGIYRTVVLGKLPKIRKMAAIEAIDEGIGRAVETGSGVHCGIPGGALGGQWAAATLIGLSIMAHFAKKAAKAGVSAMYTTSVPPILTVMEGTISDAYLSEGKLDDFNNPDMVLLRNFMPYDLVYAGVISRENIGFTLITGQVGKPMLFIGEAGRVAGAFSILAYPIIDKIEWAVPTFDYVLMLQETYAAGAWLTGDKTQLGSIIGVDIATWVMIGLVIFFTGVASYLGSDLGNILVG